MAVCLAARSAACSSNLGIVVTLIGATRDLPNIRLQWALFCLSIDLRCEHALNPDVLASANMCISFLTELKSGGLTARCISRFDNFDIF